MKTKSHILIQWGWELSQQWSSGEFRQIRVCNQKGQKGSTGWLSWTQHAQPSPPCCKKTWANLAAILTESFCCGDCWIQMLTPLLVQCHFNSCRSSGRVSPSCPTTGCIALSEDFNVAKSEKSKTRVESTWHFHCLHISNFPDQLLFPAQVWIQCIKAKRLTVGPGSRHFRIVILWRTVFTFLYWKIAFTCQDSMLASGVGNPTRCRENGTGYTFSYFRGKALVRKPSKITFCRRPGCRQFKMLEYVDTCWHFIFNLLHLSFAQWFYVQRLPAWKNGLLSWHNLEKKRNYPIHGNPWLPKCTVQLPSLNL